MMLPPMRGDSAHTNLNPNAPLSTWRTFPLGPYPSNEACEAVVNNYKETDRREGDPPGSDFGFEMAQCVSTDDPRLKSSLEPRDRPFRAHPRQAIVEG